MVRMLRVVCIMLQEAKLELQDSRAHSAAMQAAERAAPGVAEQVPTSTASSPSTVLGVNALPWPAQVKAAEGCMRQGASVLACCMPRLLVQISENLFHFHSSVLAEW